MSIQFWGDQRAVSEVVGAILLFGILILALTSYQAAVVPTQNAQTEFDHNKQVEDEMVDLRNALLEARSSGTDTFASIKLGTQYRERIVAINPAPASGTLQTVQQDNITVVEGDGQRRDDPLGLDDRPLENQFIEYTPRYSEYQSAGTIRYENTVTYHQYPDANITLTDQRLLQGDRVTLAPIEGEVNENGVQRVSVEPIPGILQTVRIESPEITVPTELSEEDWNQLLVDELSDEEEVEVNNGVLTLELVGTYKVAYSPIGANSPPAEGERGGSGTEINPAAPGNVQLVGSNWDGGNDRVTMNFRNNGDDNSFTEGRVNFYFTSSSSGNKPTSIEEIRIVENSGSVGDNLITENWVIGDDFNDLSPKAEIAGEGAVTKLQLDFEGNVRNSDFFVITFTLETAETATYFVGDDDPDVGNGDLQVTEGDGDNNGDLTFSVENTGSADAVIEGISVDSTTNNNADRVQRNGNEFERTDGAGSLDEIIEIDGIERSLDTPVTISEDTEADFLLGRFLRSNDNSANMNNVDVTITFYFDDGTQQQLLIEG